MIKKFKELSLPIRYAFIFVSLIVLEVAYVACLFITGQADDGGSTAIGMIVIPLFLFIDIIVFITLCVLGITRSLKQKNRKSLAVFLVLICSLAGCQYLAGLKMKDSKNQVRIDIRDIDSPPTGFLIPPEDPILNGFVKTIARYTTTSYFLDYKNEKLEYSHLTIRASNEKIYKACEYVAQTTVSNDEKRTEFNWGPNKGNLLKGPSKIFLKDGVTKDTKFFKLRLLDNEYCIEIDLTHYPKDLEPDPDLMSLLYKFKRVPAAK